MRVLTVIGTRPNFIKVSRFRKVASAFPNIELKIVHTGQHYDGKMADVFFEQFGLTPDYFLGVPPGTPNQQMANIMLSLEKVCAEFRPDLMMVVGDVNSTLAAALTANKLNIRLAHVESGLRSNDRTMPEEFNRVLTDQLADILFVTEPSGLEHLAEERSKAAIHFVGNTMIDTIVEFSREIEQSPVLGQLKVSKGSYVLMTMHRPSNVDSKEGLQLLLELVNKLTQHYQIVFPVHPRTVKFMEQYDLAASFRSNSQLIFTEPVDYFGFQKLTRSAAFVLTDSGGIQEETTFLGVPCLTLRPNTERPVTVTVGTNTMLPFDVPSILKHVELIRKGEYKKGEVPPLWDGHATERIFAILNELA
jgi:UDP-N-acetylglucosamine 2-epimerase (non-hydrolysing)